MSLVFLLVWAYDYSGLVQAIIDFFTIFLVTIPAYFINSALNSGFIFDLWTAFFGNNKIVQVIFIFLIIGGPLLVLSNQSKKNIKPTTKRGSKL